MKTGARAFDVEAAMLKVREAYGNDPPVDWAAMRADLESLARLPWVPAPWRPEGLSLLASAEVAAELAEVAARCA